MTNDMVQHAAADTRREFSYLAMAKAVSRNSNCLRKRFGAVIVRDDQVVSIGANTTPKNCQTCAERGGCHRIIHNIPRGTDYTTACRSVHAEMNALINADPEKLRDSTLYLYGWDCESNDLVQHMDCCALCKRMIINGGISRVVFADNDRGVPDPDGEASYRAEHARVDDWSGENCDQYIMGAY